MTEIVVKIGTWFLDAYFCLIFNGLTMYGLAAGAIPLEMHIK